MNDLPEDVRSKLKSAGIKSVAEYVSCAPGKIASRTGLPYKEVVDIRRKLLHEFGCVPVAASNLWKETTHAFLPTGCPNLDQLLDGGLLTGELIEVCGGAGTGKTQLCHSVGSYISMATSSTVAYIDTTGSFDAQLVRQALDMRCLPQEDIEVAMDKIRVFQTFTIFELLSLLTSLKEALAQQEDSYHSNLHLIIIDPVTPLLSPHLGGQHSHGHLLMSQLVTMMRELAREQGVAVLYTNNMVGDFSKEGRLKPALGVTWSHTPSTRITLSTTLTAEDSPLRVATISKAQRQPVGVSTTFTITSSGVQ